MAVIYKVDENTGELVPIKLTDNGDGTFSEAVALGAGGGAVTIADGADIAQGAKGDVAVTNPTLSASEIALLKGLLTQLQNAGANASKIQGAAADGAAVAGNPVLMAVVDGSGNVQQILGDTSGRVIIIGNAANGAAAVNNPIWVAGFDGSNVRGILTDTNGRIMAVGNVAGAATDSGNPVKTGGKYNATPPAFTDGQRGDTQITAQGDTRVQAGGLLASVSVEFTRPSDTTAYAANDVVSDSTSASTLQNIANFARYNGGSGHIVGARLTTDKKSITPRIRVHIFNASNPTVGVDNAAWRESYADNSKRIAFFDLPAMTTGADTTNSDMSRAIDMTLRIPFIAAAGSRSLYYLLETLDAFTPASAEKFTLTLFGDLD